MPLCMFFHEYLLRLKHNFFIIEILVEGFNIRNTGMTGINLSSVQQFLLEYPHEIRARNFPWQGN